MSIKHFELNIDLRLNLIEANALLRTGQIVYKHNGINFNITYDKYGHLENPEEEDFDKVKKKHDEVVHKQILDLFSPKVEN